MAEKKVKFQSYDGYKLEGTLTSSKDERAAVLFVHGITSSRDELGFHSDYATFLAGHGISSFRFDYRYHGIFEAPLSNLTLCGIVNDIDAAFLALKAHVGKGIRNFFLVGTSYGGGLSLFWADFNNEKEIGKIILNAPVINYEDDVLERNGLLVDGHLSEKAKKHLAKKGYVKSSDIHYGRGLINELKYINGVRALQNLGDKVVIFHGDEDEDVPLESSRRYKTPDTTLRVIKGVGHGFGIEIDEDLTHPETKRIHKQIYAEALTFLEKEL
jgi:pimeloyl-ACP methyl ester carboxylesterase